MDIQFGQDAILQIRAQDYLTGQPMTGAAGNIDWTLYGPGSATAITTGTSEGLHRGDGWYTIQIPVANLALPGMYTLEYDIASPATAEVTGRRFQFRVGNVVRGAWRMRDLMASLIRAAGGMVRPSDSIEGAVLTDAYLGGNIYNTLNGSEVVLLDPGGATTMAEFFVARVSGTDGSTGALTLNKSTGLTGDTGRQYGLLSPRGVGPTWEVVLDELRLAYDEVGPTVLASDSVSLVAATNTLEYRLPDDFLSVAQVFVQPAGQATADVWDDVGSMAWEVVKDRRLLRLDQGLGLAANDAIRVVGAVRCEVPAMGGAWTDMRGTYLRDLVKFRLLAGSPEGHKQREAQALYGNLARQPSPVRRPDAREVWLS